jgi:hypothetical protein
MLYEEHLAPPYNTHYDENTYICGMINGHAFVVATCLQGETGNVNAGRLTGSMFTTFPTSGWQYSSDVEAESRACPSPEGPLDNIRIGDVVGWPGDGKPACVYHDQGGRK